MTYETIRDWSQHFGGIYAKRLRSRAARPGDRWHLDEVYLSINGKIHSLRGPEYRLWLKDPLAIYGVKNAMLAPGYRSPDKQEHGRAIT